MRKDIISTAIKLCIAILAPIIFFIGLLVIDSLEYEPVGKKEIIQNYIDNKNLFGDLAICLQEKRTNISIYKDKDKGFKLSRDIYEFNDAQGKMDNEKLKENILYLFNKLKFKIIIKENSKIYFVRQNDLRFDQGIIFFKDGKIPESKEFSTLESIEGNWYYYESKS